MSEKYIMIEYKIYKSQFAGWKAETQVDLEDKKVLTIVTMKRASGALTTTASVGTKEGMFVTHMMYQDFNKTINSSFPKRVTQKLIEAQHIGTVVENIVEEVKTFYKK